MSYHQYGITTEMVDRMKQKLKQHPAVKERVKMLMKGVTKADLQDRRKVKKLLTQASRVMEEKLTEQQTENFTRFVTDQKIDPGNALHLIRLWKMFH